MRFLILAFVVTAHTFFSTIVQAQEGVSPEVFISCEAKWPDDFKQQLACVKEQSEALNALKALKEPKSRQIVVQPKTQVTATPDSKSEPAVAATPPPNLSFEALDAETYCKGLTTEGGAPVDYRSCFANETAAHEAMAAAIAAVDSDIPGDPFIACRNYITAYQPLAENTYLPQVYMLQCLKAKAPTRDFGRCYQNYEHRIFNRDVTSVSVENANFVANCYLSTLAGAP